MILSRELPGRSVMSGGRTLIGQPPVGSASTEAEREEALVCGGALLGGRYRLIRKLGTGGMSTVYLAEHVDIGKQVAIKVLDERAKARPVLRERFMREARGSASIHHPHVVEISDFGESEAGVPFMVMEYLDGKHLGHALVEVGCMPWARVARLAVQIASGLSAAHAAGVVHRDLKLENCVLSRDQARGELVKVIDFGIAKFADHEPLTREGLVVGTPQYLAPECIERGEADHRADIYALGIIMFELLTGRAPFDGPNLMEVLSAHSYDPVPAFAEVAPGVEFVPGVELIVRKALQKRASDRFTDMDEMVAAIEALVSGAHLHFSLSEDSRSRPRVRGPMVFAKAPKAELSTGLPGGADVCRSHGEAARARSSDRARAVAIVVALVGLACLAGSVGLAIAVHGASSKASEAGEGDPDMRALTPSERAP